jgi:hypothetical protein
MTYTKIHDQHHRLRITVEDIPSDKGMTHRVLIFGLYGFKPRSKPVERMIKAHKGLYLAQPRKPKLGVHSKNLRKKISSKSYSSRVKLAKSIYNQLGE